MKKTKVTVVRRKKKVLSTRTLWFARDAAGYNIYMQEEKPNLTKGYSGERYNGWDAYFCAYKFEKIMGIKWQLYR